MYCKNCWFRQYSTTPVVLCETDPEEFILKVFFKTVDVSFKIPIFHKFESSFLNEGAVRAFMSAKFTKSDLKVQTVISQ